MTERACAKPLDVTGLGCMLELELDTEADTLALAQSLAAVVQGGDVIGLEGGLGAGKTTFARGAIHGLGVSAQTPITSPTFSLVQEYRGRVLIVHADLYRLGDEADLEELGLEELLDEGAVLFVEWGRNFPEIAARTVLWVELEIVWNFARLARLRPQGLRGDAIIGALRERLRA